MATRARRNILANLLWEGIGIGPAAGQCLRIQATRDDLDLVAGWLLGTGFSYPDQDQQLDTDRPLTNLNQQLLNALRYIGLQLLHDSPDCEEFDMPYPILRQNPENTCQMQQSVDGGETWTTVFDTSVCQPEIPTPAQMIQLRQNPYHPEWLEQSFNSGFFWTLAFDYSKVRPRASSVENNILYNQYQDIINTYNQVWNSNSTVNNFAPNMVYDGGATEDDDQRDKAICAAIQAFYDVMVNTILTAGDPTNDAAAAAAGGLVGAIGSAATPAIGFIAGAIAAALVKGIGLLGKAISSPAYAEARDDVICCMYTNLVGGTLTESRFQSAVDDCGFSGTTENVRVVVGQFINDRSVYLTFLKLASQYFDYAEFAALPDCPCDEVDQECVEVDYVVNTGSALGIPSGVSATVGDLVEITVTGYWVEYAGAGHTGPSGGGAGPAPSTGGWAAPGITALIAIAKVQGEANWHAINASGSFRATASGPVMVNINFADQYYDDVVEGTMHYEVCVTAGSSLDIVSGTPSLWDNPCTYIGRDEDGYEIWTVQSVAAPVGDGRPTVNVQDRDNKAFEIRSYTMDSGAPDGWQSLSSAGGLIAGPTGVPVSTDETPIGLAIWGQYSTAVGAVFRVHLRIVS